MARVSEGELARLAAEVSLVRLVEGKGVALVERDGELTGPCLFHEDAGSSLVVSANRWSCPVCGSGGPVEFVMRSEGVSQRHAVDLLRQGVGVSDAAPVGRSTVAKLPQLVSPGVDDAELLERVVAFYGDTLRESPDALGFLARRRVDHPEVVEAFRLGFSDRSLGYRLPAKNRRDGADLRAAERPPGALAREDLVGARGGRRRLHPAPQLAPAPALPARWRRSPDRGGSSRRSGRPAPHSKALGWSWRR